MKRIIDDLLYDTEKSERIFSFRRKVVGGAVLGRPGYNYVNWHEMDLYKSKGGRYFIHDKDAQELSLSHEEEAQGLLKKLDPDKFIELFGQVDEA